MTDRRKMGTWAELQWESHRERTVMSTGYRLFSEIQRLVPHLAESEARTAAEHLARLGERYFQPSNISNVLLEVVSDAQMNDIHRELHLEYGDCDFPSCRYNRT